MIIFTLQAKIDEEYQNQKVLEKPEVFVESRVHRSSTPSTVVMKQFSETYETVPPEPSKKYPKLTGGEDPDPITQQRRDKVKEVCVNCLIKYLLIKKLYSDQSYGF